jgi:predicted neuraminidase
VLLCLLWIAGPGSALELGQQAGPVSFVTIDGGARVMDNYGDRPGTAVVFLSARSEETVQQMAAINRVHVKYRLDDVLFVGVCSDPDQDATELRTFLQHTGTIFPLHRDQDGAVAKQFGATVTPEVFLLDKTGSLIFHGGIGENGEALEAATVALLAGRPVKKPSVAVSGSLIDADLPQRTIADPFESFSFSSELVFDRIPGAPAHHCSTLAEASNGDMLCLWYGGSFESADDQALWLSRLPKGMRTWSTPERLIADVNMPPGNAVIFREPEGRVAIIWGRMEGKRPTRRGSGWGTCRLFYRSSSDNGLTWSADQELPGTFGWLPRNIPLTLPDGRFALPVSGETKDDDGSFLLVRGAGNTWTRSGIMPGASQPTVIARDNGELLSLMRSRPRIKQSVSKDNGETWSKPVASVLNNPGAGIAMTKLKSGRVVLVYNNSEDSRSPLNLIQSTDDGETWGDLRTLESDPGPYSYPCIYQADDGTVHVAYTYRRYSIKHVAFSEPWLVHTDRPN